MDTYNKAEPRAFVYRFVKRLISAFIVSLILAIFLGGAFALAGAPNISVYIFGITLLIQLMWAGLVIFLESKVLGYRLETNAILWREGVFSVAKITIPYAKTTNATFTQSLLQRLFSVGDVIIDQEDSESVLDGVDSVSAHKILEEISKKSNIQPVYLKK